MNEQGKNPTSNSPVSPMFVILGIGLIGFCAFVTYVLWSLGAGISPKIHISIGIFFGFVHFICFTLFLLFAKRERIALALVIVVAPVPICLGFILGIAPACALVGAVC